MSGGENENCRITFPFFSPNLSFYFLTFFYVELRSPDLKRACVCNIFFSVFDTRERLPRARVQPTAERRHQKARTNADYDLIFSRLTVCGFAEMAVNNLVCCVVVVAELWD